LLLRAGIQKFCDCMDDIAPRVLKRSLEPLQLHGSSGGSVESLVSVLCQSKRQTNSNPADCFRMPAISDKPCRSIWTKGGVPSTTFKKDVPVRWGSELTRVGEGAVHPTGTSLFKYRRNQIFCIADSRQGRGGAILSVLTAPPPPTSRRSWLLIIGIINIAHLNVHSTFIQRSFAPVPEHHRKYRVSGCGCL